MTKDMFDYHNNFNGASLESHDLSGLTHVHDMMTKIKYLIQNVSKMHRDPCSLWWKHDKCTYQYKGLSLVYLSRATCFH